MNVNLNTRKAEPLSTQQKPAPAPAGKAPGTNFSDLLKSAKASAAPQAVPPAPADTAL